MSTPTITPAATAAAELFDDAVTCLRNGNAEVEGISCCGDRWQRGMRNHIRMQASGCRMPAVSGLIRKSRIRRFIMQPAEQHSLYDRLGGVYSIATVVDDFVDRIMVDPRLNANPLVDEAHHRVPPAGFKYLVTEMVCWATGGPQKYTGKSMADSHSHLKITAKEWEAFLDDFQQTLDTFKVPAGEQSELKAIVNSTRSDIVVPSALDAEVA
jgi:hemoglobin